MGALVVFGAILAFQVAVPVQRLVSGQDGPTSFGWQMFSTVRERPIYQVRYPGGRIDTVRIADHVARMRQEIDFLPLLPPHLCRHLDGAAAVLVERPSADPRASTREAEFRCPRTSP